MSLLYEQASVHYTIIWLVPDLHSAATIGKMQGYYFFGGMEKVKKHKVYASNITILCI